MPLGAEGLLLFVLFILPGVVARSEAERAAPIPSDRIAPSWVRDLADALAYSTLLSPISALVGLGILWSTTRGDFGLLDLVTLGLPGVLKAVPIQTLLALSAYVLSSLALAELAGVFRIAAKLRARATDLAHVELSDEPIWWSVLETRAREYEIQNNWNKVEVFLNVPLTNGARYTGLLLYFPIVTDTASERDVAIWKAHYYPPDGDGQELPPDDVVLINSRDCLAVEVRYVEARSIVIQPQALELKLSVPPPTVVVAPKTEKSS